MIVMSSSTDWPPRRLPSRVRLFRIRLIQFRGGLRRQGGSELGPSADVLLPAVQRLALWTGWLGLTASAFVLIDLYL
jgi:hypothetical protein